MPETEVLSDRDVRRAQALDEDVLDELAGGLVGEPVVERDHDELSVT